MRSSESPYRAAVSIWLTPYRSSTSSARSASAWLARARAAPPKSVTLLRWPVLPNGRRSIIAAPPVAAADYLAKMLPEPGEDLLPPVHRRGLAIVLAAARAIADDPDLAVEVRQGAQVVDGTLDISHRAIVRHAAGRADAGAVLLRRRLSLAEVQVR